MIEQDKNLPEENIEFSCKPIQIPYSEGEHAKGTDGKDYCINSHQAQAVHVQSHANSPAFVYEVVGAPLGSEVDKVFVCLDVVEHCPDNLGPRAVQEFDRLLGRLCFYGPTVNDQDNSIHFGSDDTGIGENTGRSDD